MEELSAALASSARVSLEDSDVSLIHPRYAEYKMKSTSSSQEERRRQWLQNQKNKRMEVLNIHRGVVGNCRSIVEKMELETSSKNYQKKTWIKNNKQYKDWIMWSEWLIDVPSELQEDWFCTICPEGKRVLVVADMGSTIAYSRKGDFLLKFPSALPGGNGEGARGYTVVDCVWHHPTKTFYLLDVLIWGIPFTDCEAELRFFWLSNKFSEIPTLTQCSTTNRHRFLLLQHNPVSQLEQMLSVHPPFENNFPMTDGILFFHKDSLYTGGKSPLVTWLKPFMIPDILGISVADQFMKEKPANYPDKPVVNMETEINNIAVPD